MSKNRGMLPGEIMKTALIEVWPDPPINAEMGFSGRSVSDPAAALGWGENRPDFYVAVARRNENRDWHFELLKAMPSGESHIPGEVMERFIRMRQRIMDEQRSDRSRNQALERMASGVKPFAKSD